MEALKVLFIDDDRNVCTRAQQLLERKGFSVRSAFSGEEALEKLRTFTPDIILLDMVLPKMDGITTFHSIKKHFSKHSIPIVFLTDATKQKKIDEYKKLGATAVITKPFSSTNLANDVYQLWNQQRLVG